MRRKFKFKGSYFSYFLMYQFYYFSWALFSALISVYLLDKGYTATEVSLVLSGSYIFSMIAQPIIGYLSDIYNVKMVNTVLLILSGIGGLAFMASTNLGSLIFFYGIVIALISGTNPVIEKMAVTSKFSYGKIRVWGTIGFATGSQIAGIIYDKISPEAMFLFFAASIVLTIIGLYGTEVKIEKLDVNLEASVDSTEEENKNKGYFNVLFKNKLFLMYLLISALYFGIASVAHSYLPAMFQASGLEVSVVSFILFIAVICEVPLVFYSSKFMDKISNKKLLIIVFSLITIQFFSYCMIPVVWIQVLVTFLTKHVAGIIFIMANLKIVSTIVDVRYQVSALALVATLSKNLSTIILQNVSGFVLDNYGYRLLFLIFMIIAIIGLISALFYKVPSGNDKKLFS